MAELAFTDAVVTINSVVLSDHVRSVTIDYSAEILDKTAMGNTSRARIAGLKDWSMSIEFNQDFAASEVDVTLFSLIGAAAFPVSVLPASGGVTATNPDYNGNAVLETYPPMGNAVGELSTTTITLQGDGDLTRSTS